MPKGARPTSGWKVIGRVEGRTLRSVAFGETPTASHGVQGRQENIAAVGYMHGQRALPFLRATPPE